MTMEKKLPSIAPSHKCMFFSNQYHKLIWPSSNIKYIWLYRSKGKLNTTTTQASKHLTRYCWSHSSLGHAYNRKRGIFQKYCWIHISSGHTYNRKRGIFQTGDWEVNHRRQKNLEKWSLHSSLHCGQIVFLPS
jgi:hypothetical protein